MWDSNAPLQILKTMPKRLGSEELERLQMVIDADKYKNSLVSGFDLCGMYAPFCKGCKKTSIYPCALAYINMIQAEGADVEIDAKPVTGTMPNPVLERPIEQIEKVISEAEEKVVEDKSVTVSEQNIQPEIQKTVSEEVAVSGGLEEYSPEKVQNETKRRIRIALARKK